MIKRVSEAEMKYLKMILYGGPGAGKAQPLEAKILTPKGWTSFKDIKVEDVICHPSGGTSKVIGVFPQGEKEIYQVRFSDGSQVQCCKDHLWLTQTWNERKRNSKGSIKSLEEIMETLERKDTKGANHFIPMVAPLDFVEQQVPIAPYLLGALLGDGCFQKHFVLFTSTDQEILDKIEQLLPEGVELKRINERDFRLGRKANSRLNPLVSALRALGLLEEKSNTKYIPEIYKFGQALDRLALLQGLLDTDGSCEMGPKKKFGNVTFTTTSFELLSDIKWLVQSLGGVASLGTICHPKYSYKGEVRKGLEAYTTYIRLPEGIPPFTLKRKLEKMNPIRKYHPSRSFKEIAFVGSKEAACIAVDAPDGLYITDDAVVTHNTFTALTLATALGKTLLIDTERGAEAYKSMFDFSMDSDEEGHTTIARTLEDANRILDEGLEAGFKCIIIDQITHLWESAQEQFLVKEREKQSKIWFLLEETGNLPWTCWRHIKKPYRAFLRKLSNAPAHTFILGRVAVEYGGIKDGELIKKGERLDAEKNTQYEPQILVKMEANLKKKQVLALVERDKWRQIEGEVFINPTIDMLKPVLGKLGKVHGLLPEEADEEGSKLLGSLTLIKPPLPSQIKLIKMLAKKGGIDDYAVEIMLEKCKKEEAGEVINQLTLGDFSIFNLKEKK